MNLISIFKVKLLLIISLHIINAEDISLTTKNGRLNGKIDSIDGKEVKAFLGIPYAEPPVGKLRFRKPVPKNGWSEPIDATRFSSDCIQNNIYKNERLYTFNESEDCLYLNIWTPKWGSSDELRPVIFHIHSGALMFLSAAHQIFDGTVLSAKGDVVFVSINYRLNIFGFLYTGTDDAPGNVGLWDQTLALKWVNHNIQYFGGDPKRITIYGSSAGGWSVGLHILSPISRNLFNNAIMSSGAAIDRNVINNAEEGIRQWVKISNLSGCTDRENIYKNEFTEKVIKCLKDSEPEVLIKAMKSPELTAGTFGWLPMVVIDGEFLTDKPLTILRNGNHKRDLKLLFSLVEDEGSLFLPIMSHHMKYMADKPQNFSYSEAFEELKQISEDFPTLQKINGNDVSKMYFTGLSDSNDFDLLRRTIGIAIGDYVFSCPSIQFAKQLFYSYKKTVNIYQYYYRYKSQFDFNCAKWMGVCHGSDVIMTSGFPFMHPNAYSDSDREMSKILIEIYSNFAKTGHPRKQNGVDWPQFYTINDKIIAPYIEITNEPKPVINFGNNLKTFQCDYLWNPYIYNNL